ncbi:3-keto-5-aminohexanoate cleavage enzyme [Defluviimonas aquaemixtae]|uniref:3-keto-5-aminohexanoate cleavage enzyme n=1 Tax=Albidovulum aquaemixtae TaxID=1542388 RepID=A0A2R8BM16_9RHOB|nr:3-keto-5-aminohexanoate cleavage protein [Defluviimonas aquaemixtae]SPH24438.1 3-keto-5-aminohexanoate cleavage enzyme [Defluviimonas aquaemixtae]
MTLPRLMVAPTGARPTKKDHPALPVTIPEIVEAAVGCQKAGAGGLHAHIRDADGTHTLDAGLYAELLAELAREAPGLYVQITSEAAGRFTPAEQRALIETLRPAAVSIALREITAEENASVTARFFAFCHEAGIEVQHILYDAADMSRLAHLVAEGTIPRDNLAVLHVLGRYTTGQTSDPADLDAPLSVQFASGLSPDWAVCAFGPAEIACLLAALKAGGKARVGFENNRQNRDGTIAASNAERIRDLIAAATDAGLTL